METGQGDDAGNPPRRARSGYEREERAYAEWMHHFVEKLSQHVPAQAFPRLMPIAAYWASHARHMDPQDAAQVAALWCCPEAAEAGTASCEEAAALDGEFEHLCQVEQRICDTTARIAMQECLVDWLASRHHETREAVALLDSLRSALEALYDARATALLRWGMPQHGPIIRIRH